MSISRQADQTADYGPESDSELSSLLSDPNYANDGEPESDPAKPADHRPTGQPTTPYDFGDEWDQEVSLETEADAVSEDTETGEDGGDPLQRMIDSGLDPKVVDEIRGVLAREQAQTQQPGLFNPQQRQQVPPPPVSPAILNPEVFKARADSIAARYLPHFQQAEANGDAATMQAIALRYEADQIKLATDRDRTLMMYQAYQVALQHEQLLQSHNGVQRQAAAERIAKEFKVPVEQVLTHPVTKEQLWDEGVMRATAAALAMANHTQARAGRARAADQPLRSGGGSAPDRDDSARLARMNPFGREFDALLKRSLAGHTIDPRQLPRRSQRR